MTLTRQALGKLGEDLAVKHLQDRGYKIIDRNVRVRNGEIDIVAQHKNIFVFVEVRARRSRQFGSALESVGPQKQRQLLRTAQQYIAFKNLHGLPCRIDVIGVSWPTSHDKPVLEHVENALLL